MDDRDYPTLILICDAVLIRMLIAQAWAAAAPRRSIPAYSTRTATPMSTATGMTATWRHHQLLPMSRARLAGRVVRAPLGSGGTASVASF
jgi:hypothetical protein